MAVFRAGISSLSGMDCTRRIVLTLLKNRLGVQSDIGFNGYLLAGNILHDLVQQLFRRKQKIGLIEYFHYRKDLDMVDSILESMCIGFKEWESFVTSDRFPFASDIDEVDRALRITENQMSNLANMSETMMLKDEVGIHSRCLAEEYTVQTIVGNRVLLTGHIDMVALMGESLKLIELKTGRPRKMHANQLQLYGEIVRLTNPDMNLELELWYSKTGKRMEVSFSDEPLLMNLESLVHSLSQVETQSDLPQRNERAENCRYCDLCDLADSLLKEKRNLQNPA